MSTKTLSTLKHLGFMIVVAGGSAVLTWLGTGPAVDLFSTVHAIVFLPVVVALVSSVVHYAQANE